MIGRFSWGADYHKLKTYKPTSDGYDYMICHDNKPDTYWKANEWRYPREAMATCPTCNDAGMLVKGAFNGPCPTCRLAVRCLRCDLTVVIPKVAEGKFEGECSQCKRVLFG